MDNDFVLQSAINPVGGTVVNSAPGESLVPNPWALLEDKCDPQTPIGTNQIYSFVIEHFGRDPKDTNVFRASSAPRCPRQNWYKYRGYPGKGMAPRAIINFLQGDIAERVKLYFIRVACVGPGKLYSEVDFGEVLGEIHFQNKPLQIYKQQTVLSDARGIKIPGHADGWGKRNSDGKWELIECKSAADFGFSTFKTKGPEDYLKQSATLMASDKARELGVVGVRFFYLRKQTGHLWDRFFPYDEALWQEVCDGFHAVLKDEPPPKPYYLVPETKGRGEKKVETGRVVAGDWHCRYCPFLEECQGKFTIEWEEDWQKSGTFTPKYIFANTNNAISGGANLGEKR